MKTIKIIFILISFSSLLISCEYSASKIEEELKNIKTAEEEIIVFDDIWKNWTVNFTPLDSNGNKINMSNEDWVKQLHIVEFQHGVNNIKYEIKEPRNIFILMRE